MFRILHICVLCTLALTAGAQEVTRDQIKGLDEQVQDIKKDVLDLTSELTRLEEKLLFPSNTQVSFFVSLAGGDTFRLDSVQLVLNNVLVAQHLYTFRELEALQKGGVQRMYTGNVKTGDHSLEVKVKGKSSSGENSSWSKSYKVNKAVGPKFVEIKIAGPGSSESVSFRDW